MCSKTLDKLRNKPQKAQQKKGQKGKHHQVLCKSSSSRRPRKRSPTALFVFRRRPGSKSPNVRLQLLRRYKKPLKTTQAYTFLQGGVSFKHFGAYREQSKCLVWKLPFDWLNKHDDGTFHASHTNYITRL